MRRRHLRIYHEQVAEQRLPGIQRALAARAHQLGASLLLRRCRRVAYRPVRDISRMDVGGTRTKDGSIRLEYPDPAISMLVAVGVRIDGVAEPLVFPVRPGPVAFRADLHLVSRVIISISSVVDSAVQYGDLFIRPTHEVLSMSLGRHGQTSRLPDVARSLSSCSERSRSTRGSRSRSSSRTCAVSRFESSVI